MRIPPQNRGAQGGYQFGFGVLDGLGWDISETVEI